MVSGESLDPGLEKDSEEVLRQEWSKQGLMFVLNFFPCEARYLPTISVTRCFLMELFTI